MQEYDVIRRARAMLESSDAGSPSARTVAGYKARAKRIFKLVEADAEDGKAADVGTFIGYALQTRSASTWFGRRAALLYAFRKILRKHLAEQDKLQRSLKAANVPVDSGQWDGWRDLVRRAGIWMEGIDQLQNTPGPAVNTRKPRHSKRKDMKGLSDDWRERIVLRCQKYRHAVLVSAVTGCRPDELVKGVNLSIAGGELIAEITGSKVTEESGQPWRRLTWPVDSDSPLVTMLVAEVRSGLSVAKIEDARIYSGAVRAAGEREWPGRKKKISPYCFRHAAASDMKASGIGDSAISQALGHCADVARSYYGQWQQGAAGSGVSPMRVESARAVRMKKGAKPATEPYQRLSFSARREANCSTS